jgi:cell division protein FtsN
LIVAVFGVLCALAYYFLGDFIVKRKGQETGLNMGGATGQAGIVTASSPITAPSTSVKSPDTVAPAGGNASAAPPVVTPKPQEATSTGGKSGKEVPIPPISAPPAGRTGPSQTPKLTTPSLPTTPNRGNLTIQIGSFKDQAEADGRAAKLKSQGVDARVVRADIPGKGTWYRVQVGGFASREEASSYGNQLRSKGLVQDFIVTTIAR